MGWLPKIRLWFNAVIIVSAMAAAAFGIQVAGNRWELDTLAAAVRCSAGNKR